MGGNRRHCIERPGHNRRMQRHHVGQERRGEAHSSHDRPKVANREMAQPRLSRSETAYEHLLEEVLRGRFQPGETLSIYALAEELQVSRTPVAEALKRLESEGLVEIIPQVGCRVTRHNAPDVAELFALCGALDGLAAQAAAANIDDRGLLELRLVSDALEAAAAGGDKAAILDADYAFHMAIIEASGSPRVARVARSSWVPLRFQLSLMPSPSEAAIAACISEHRDIVDAIECRTGKQARAATERHATNSAAQIARQLRSAS